MKKRLSWFLTGVLVSMVGICFAQGPLAPPGPPGEIYKTLDQVEPRIPINLLPYTISAPGSYYLTKDMDYPTIAQNGITINASNVTIDLMGFTLKGPGKTGNTRSAITLVTGTSNITIKNGNINYWGNDGIECDPSTNTRVMNITVSFIGDLGIVTDYNSQIVNCSVSGCTDDGIHTGYNSLVKDCVARDCDTGIYGELYNMLVNCGAYDNNSDGIYIRSGGVVQNCIANSNTGNGIMISGSVTITGCTTYNNISNGIGFSSVKAIGGDAQEKGGENPALVAPPIPTPTRPGINIVDCTSDSNGNNGIEVGRGSRIQGCLVKSNAGNGIDIAESIPLTVGELYDSITIVKDCMCYSNTKDGIVVFSYVVIEGNTCVGNNNGIYVESEGGIVVAPQGGSAPAPPPGKGNRIQGNSTMNNTDHGVYVPLNSNSLIIRNWSYSNGDDYHIGNGNTFGPILTGDLSANDNPHANYTFILL